MVNFNSPEFSTSLINDRIFYNFPNGHQVIVQNTASGFLVSVKTTSNYRGTKDLGSSTLNPKFFLDTTFNPLDTSMRLIDSNDDKDILTPAELQRLIKNVSQRDQQFA